MRERHSKTFRSLVPLFAFSQKLAFKSLTYSVFIYLSSGPKERECWVCSVSSRFWDEQTYKGEEGRPKPSNLFPGRKSNTVLTEQWAGDVRDNWSLRYDLQRLCFQVNHHIPKSGPPVVSESKVLAAYPEMMIGSGKPILWECSV